MPSWPHSSTPPDSPPDAGAPGTPRRSTAHEAPTTSPPPRSTGACDGELTIPEFCHKLGIARSAVYDWIGAGKLDAHKTDAGRWHIPFDETIEARCREMIATSAHLGTKNRNLEAACEGEITVPALAARLGISTVAVLGWIHAGKLDAHRTRVSRRWHIRFDDAVEARCRDMIATSVRLGAKHNGGAAACEGELTIRQLRERLGIGRGTILGWINTGKLTAHQTTQGYWHIPYDETVDAHCRKLIETSRNLGRKQRTQRTDAGGAV